MPQDIRRYLGSQTVMEVGFTEGGGLRQLKRKEENQWQQLYEDKMFRDQKDATGMTEESSRPPKDTVTSANPIHSGSLL